MRSHAKASTAGSTQRRAKGLGRIFGGAFETGGGSLEAKGSSAPVPKALIFPLAVLAAVFALVLGVGSASAVAPTVSSTSVSTVTAKTALLEAEINPKSEATTYHFEYGLADCSANPCASAPAPNANVGAGNSAVKVSQEIAGLSPGTTYHFRVVALNASGPAAGPDRTFMTFDQVALDTNCPNQDFRYGPGAFLPDCRAYEMVSPVDKNGGDIRTLSSISGHRSEITQASLDGDKYTYSSYKAFAGAVAASYTNQYLASRGSDGWSSESISPPRSVWSSLPPESTTLDAQFKAFTDDLSQGWFTDRSRFPLTPDAIEGFSNIYGRDNSDGSIHALTSGPTPSQFGLDLVHFYGHSTDGSHAVFGIATGFTSVGAPRYEIYDYAGGQRHLVSVLPNGDPNPEVSRVGGGGGDFVQHGEKQLEHAVSEDGTRVFWNSAQGTQADRGTLYVSIAGEPTVAISQSVTTTQSQFRTASADGSTAVFSFDGDSTTGGSNGPKIDDLYEFDVDTETPTLIAHEVLGVVGASDDLSYLYFASKDALAPGATAGERNLYVRHEGTLIFIATLAEADTGEVAGVTNEDDVNYVPSAVSVNPIERAARVTDDGRHIAFMSTRSLTGYDNTDAINGKADFEVFHYDAEAGELTCVSCNPSGARPVGKALPKPYDFLGKTFFQPGGVGDIEYWTAGWLPTWENSLHDSRALSEDGNRVFFNAFDALVPQDTNGKQDVYQWESQGVGSCQKVGGCVSLISTGQSGADSEFMDASPSGDEVFFRTESRIDPRDTYGRDIYVASVDGGFPPPPPPPPPCVGDACQSVPAAPNDPTPASASFRGAGNPAPPRLRRRCKARARGSKAKRQANSKRAKHCRRANRRASR